MFSSRGLFDGPIMWSVFELFGLVSRIDEVDDCDDENKLDDEQEFELDSISN